VALGSSSSQWDLRVPMGSKSSWDLTMYQSDGLSPFVIAGHTFEYIVRTAPTAPDPPLVQLQSDVPAGPIPAGGGLIVVSVTPVSAVLTFAIYPPATALVPGTYFHGMWMDYADPVNAYNLFWGNFYIDPAVQP
jgi:hypothetical protein